MTNLGQSGKQYWQQELQNMLGIQSGAMQPTDLPEFKGMANQFNAQSDQGMNRLIQQMGQRGITGGAAAGVINQGQENNMQGLLKMIQGIFANSNQRGTQAAGAGMDWEKFKQNLNAMMAMNYQKQHDQRQQAHQAQNMDFAKMGLNTIAGAFSGGLMQPGNTGTTAGASGVANGGGNADWYNRTYNNPQTSNYLQGW
jgi:hypothetical protein